MSDYLDKETMDRYFEEEMKNYPVMPNVTDEEKAYRRGYCHGFLASKRSDVTEKEVYDWRNGVDCVAPPGSCMEGMKMDGLTVEDKHRFFINRLKKVWNE